MIDRKRNEVIEIIGGRMIGIEMITGIRTIIGIRMMIEEDNGSEIAMR